MTIILACVAYVITGGLSGHITLDTGTNVPNAMYRSPERKDPAMQSCTAYKTVEAATLSAYRTDRLDAGLQLYRVNTDSLKVEKILTPTVKLVVEEQK